MSRDVAPIFADIDAMDADRFVAHLTPDARFRFANADPAIGRAAVKEGVEGFWANTTASPTMSRRSTRSAIRSLRRSTSSTAARTASRSPCPTATSWSSTATWCATGRSTSTSLPCSPDPEGRSDDHAHRYRLRQVRGRGSRSGDPLRHRYRRPRAGDAQRSGRHPPARGPPAPLSGPRRGSSGVISSGFSLAHADALSAAETELERSGVSVHRGSAAEAKSRRVREFIAFDDPFGNRVELVSQQETVARPVAFSRARRHQRVRPSLPRRTRRARGHRFWSELLRCPGVRLARRLRLPDAHRSRAPQARRLRRRRAGFAT